MESSRLRELDMNLDMDKVIVELIGFALLSVLRLIISQVLFLTKYSILHKIAITNWLPRLHISSISKDIIVFIFLIGISEPFNLEKVIFQVITSNAKSESTSGLLPFPFLIFKIVKLQKNILEKGEVLKVPRNQYEFHTRFILVLMSRMWRMMRKRN